MNEGLFRKKSMEKISSPEQLDDYIKVSNPSVWMLLSCIIILLVGMCVWGVFGRLNTTITLPVICKAGKTVGYISQEKLSDLPNKATVIIDDKEYAVITIGSEPVRVTDDFEEYALQIGSLQIGGWVYEIMIDAKLNDGIYEAEIVTESIAPMYFLLN